MEIKEILNQIQSGIYVTDANTEEILFLNYKMREEYGIKDAQGLEAWKERRGKNGSSLRIQESLVIWEGKEACMYQVCDMTPILQREGSADRDSLCDTWNRATGKKMLEKKLKELEENQSCVLAFLDIDNLKQINETYGFSEGDMVLQKISEYLSSQIDEPDFMFRLSGDEFVMVFFGKTEKTVSRMILEWRDLIEQYGPRNQKPYGVSFSYGISYTKGHKDYTMNELMDQADEQMYEEKLRRRRNEELSRSEELTLRDSKEKISMDYPAKYLYDAIVRSTDDYVYVNDVKTGMFQYTPALVKMFELPGEIVKNPLEYWKNIVHPDDWDRFYKSNMEIGENKRDAHYVEFRARARSGEYRWLRCRGHIIRDEYGEPVLFAGIMRSMGAQNEIDLLTQLFNHRMFDKRIRQDVASKGIEGLAVTILDVDNFRQINELYTRKVGDSIFCTIAQNIQALLPDNAGLFRLDNDRMGLLARNATAADMQELYGKIRKRLQRMADWKMKKLEVSLSAGCAFFPQDGKTVEELYQYADYALQYAKNQGKDRLVIFTEEILKKKNYRLELIKKLRDSMNHDFRGFSVQYQPQMLGTTGEILGAEALARFQDEEGNWISPAEFIPVMESEGMIYAMGLWVLRTSIRVARKWIQSKADFSISVNASALQIMDDAYIGDVCRILKEEDFPARNLVIELTESSAVQNLDIFRDKYKLLQAEGIRVAMDDFGTGYSSLEFLKSAPIDLVKIDRSFMRDILSSKFDLTFITFIVSICHDVNIKVCQEGVETKEEYELLREKEVDCVQGYYFGKPMDAETFARQLS